MQKTKALLGVGFSFLFVYLGYYLYTETSEKSETPILIKGIGVICMLFFGILFLAGLRKQIKR